MQTQSRFSRDISIDFHGFELLQHSSPALKGECHLREPPTSFFWCIQSDKQSFPSHRVPLKGESRLYVFSFWFFFKDVCIDFINANITMFIIQKEVITASVLIILGPEPQSISCSSVSCFYLMFLELCLKKHWRKNKDHQGFLHK